MAEYYFDFFVTFEDVKEFLNQNNIVWNGQVKSKSRELHEIDEKDMYLLLREQLVLFAFGEKVVLKWVDGLSFNSSTLASKKDWRMFLLKKYGKKYAVALKKYIDYEKGKLHKVFLDRLDYNINLLKGMQAQNPVLVQSEIDALMKSIKRKLTNEYREEVDNKFSCYEAEIKNILGPNDSLTSGDNA